MTRDTRRLISLLICVLCVGEVGADDPFATEVMEYSLAPGQFANDPDFNDPSRALGPPVSGGTYSPGNGKLVSLGGFGGSLTLAFDHTIMDHETNPFGVDAIVFGNAHWASGHANRHWAECGYVEISRDVNENGRADDAWYLIPGSHITDPAGQWQTQTWDDDFNDPTYPPDNPAWIPPGCNGTWTTKAYRLPPAVFDVTVLENPNGLDATEEGIWGYADFNPVLILGDLDGDNIIDDPEMQPEDFYTVPDDPSEVGISPRSGGGDAFDIAWAIDAATGQPANLDGFDFIRITNGENYIAGIFGEKSPEIGAVADVRPGAGDVNCDGAINNFDIDPFVLAITDPDGYDAAYPDCSWTNADVNMDGSINNFDIDSLVTLIIGP